MAYSTDAMGNYMGGFGSVDPYAQETEEQRRLRLQREAEAAGQAVVMESAMPTQEKQQPVKQTITTDPTTGRQTMKIEGSVQDLSANNPLTPTVLPPGGDAMAQQPAPVMPEAPAPVEQEQSQTQPNVQMVDGKLKLAPLQIGEGVQLAGPMVAGAVPPPAPVAPVAPASNADTLRAAQNAAAGNAIQPAPAPQPAPQPAPELTPDSRYSLAQGQPNQGIQVPGMTGVPLTQGTQLSEMQQRFQSIQDDPGSLLQYRNDTSIPEPLRRRAGERAYELLSNERQKAAAEQKFQEMIATGDNKGIANALQGRGSKGGLGDWVSLIALSYISPQMAGAKAEEMGIAPTKWTQTTVSDEKGNFKAVQVKQSSNGKILEAYNMDDTPLTAKELSRINSGADLDIVGGTYVNDTTREVGIVVRDKKNPANSYVQTDTGRKPMTGFRPQTGSGTLEMQRDAQVQRQNIELAGDWERLKMKIQSAAPEAANRYLGEFNAKYQKNFPLSSISGPAPQINAATGQMSTAPVDQAPATVMSSTTTTNTATNAGGGGGSAAKTTNTGGSATVGGGGGRSPADIEINKGLGKTQGETNIDIAGKRTESFNKILDEEVRPQAQAGDTVSSVRKQQFAIFDRPGVDTAKLFGLYNAAGEGTGDQKASILRDIFGGVFRPEAEVSTRLAALNLTPQEKSALLEYNIANQKINAATLKQNAGPGSVSNIEQEANRAANVDITKIPALGAFNAMAQSQFDGDRARYKADWAANQPAQNALQLDKAWRKENQRLGDIYRTIAIERAKFIAANGGTTAAVQLGYKRFAVPEYDPATESWKKTKPLGQIMGGQ